MCTHARGGWRASAVFSHLPLFLIVFIIGVYERDRGWGQKITLGSHFSTHTMAPKDRTQVIRLGW